MANFGSFLPAIGTIAGAAFGPAGAAIGGAIGSLGAAATAEQAPSPKYKLGAQQGLLAAQTRNLEKLQAQEGMSSAQVQRVMQAGGIQKQEQLEQMTALAQAQGLSPLEKEGILKALKTESMKRQSALLDRLSALDERAEARKLASITTGAQAASAQAAQISQAQFHEEQLQIAADQASFQNFANAMSKVAAAIPGLMGGGDSTSTDATKQQTGPSSTSGPETKAAPSIIPDIEQAGKDLGAAAGLGFGGISGAAALSKNLAVGDSLAETNLRGINQNQLLGGYDLDQSIDFLKAMEIDDLFDIRPKMQSIL